MSNELLLELDEWIRRDRDLPQTLVLLLRQLSAEMHASPDPSITPEPSDDELAELWGKYSWERPYEHGLHALRAAWSAGVATHNTTPEPAKQTREFIDHGWQEFCRINDVSEGEWHSRVGDAYRFGLMRALDEEPDDE